MSSSPLLLGDTSANSITAGWDARTPLAGWLILHKDTQALFISTLFISSSLPETSRDQTVPDGHFKVFEEGWGHCWRTGQRNRHMGVRFGFASQWTRQMNLYFKVFFLYCNIKTDTVLNKINLQPVYISTVYYREGNDILIASQNHF